MQELTDAHSLTPPPPPSNRRLAPLHALPIPSASGSKMYRGETLVDRYTIRYCNSLPMSDFCDKQAQWAKECTPWHYRKCAIIADPVAGHPASKPVMRLSDMEGKVVKSVWSSDDGDSSLLSGAAAHCNVALASERLVLEGEAKDQMKDEAEKLMDLRKGGGGEGGKRGRKGRRKKKVRAQVMVADGVWEDMPDSSDSSDDSDSGNESDASDASKAKHDSDEEDENTDHDHVLAVCRVLHISAPVEHHPKPGVLLAPPPLTDNKKKSKDLFISNGAAHLDAKAILRSLHMKHCGLVFLSRGATAQSATVSSDVSNLKSKRSIGIDIVDT